MNIDRRKEMRFPVLLPVECNGFSYDTHHPVSLDTSCNDISPHGMSLRSKMPLEAGRTCRLLFALPHYEGKREITGEVRWHTSQQDDGIAGIEFCEPIDLSIPFPAADKAVRGLQRHMDSHFSLVYQTLSDACVWVNSNGEITQCDERFIQLLGYSEAEARGRPIWDFAHGDDRQDLSTLLLGTQTIDLSSQATGLFRMHPKKGHALFWKMRVLPKPPWSTLKEIYIEDVTESCGLRDKKHQLEQLVDTLKGAVSGQVILLNSDLCIADTCGTENIDQGDRPKISFNGMDLRRATGLVKAKVNGRKLWNELQLCAQTGQEFSSELCHYKGRTGKVPDLFPPGIFRTKVTPIADLADRVASLLMVVKSEDPLGILGTYGGKEGESRNRLHNILGVAAAGFLLREVLHQACEPFTSLLARLDLLRYKLALHWEKSLTSTDDAALYDAGEFKEIEKLLSDLSNKFKYMLESTCCAGPAKTGHFEINECLSKAISIASMYEGIDSNSIVFIPRSQLPITGANEQEFVTIFLIYLLLSRDCLRNVSDTTIRCETTKDDDHIIATISHNSSILQDKYLDIVFHNKPLESYFLKSDFTCFMDTLLYYGNCLLRKNKVRTRITNIPGHFSLSLLIPAANQ
jgi:PAS domain S-box-containing protein